MVKTDSQRASVGVSRRKRCESLGRSKAASAILAGEDRSKSSRGPGEAASEAYPLTDAHGLPDTCPLWQGTADESVHDWELDRLGSLQV